MSNGASSLYEKPLPGISSCGDETPKSNRKPSTRHLGRAKQLVQVAEVALQQLVRDAGNLAVQTGASGLEGHVVLIDAEQKARLPTCAAIFTE